MRTTLMEKVANAVSKLRPRSFREYRTQFFTAEDLPRFAAYEHALTRQAHHAAQSAKYQRFFTSRSVPESAHARTRFFETLRDEDFEAWGNQLAAEHQAELMLSSAFGGLHEIFTKSPAVAFNAEFSTLAADLAAILEWMAGHYRVDLERVRPLEQARVDAERESLGQYGIDAEAAGPLEERSPVLREMVKSQDSLESTIRSLRSGKTGASTAMTQAGTYIAPVLAAIKSLPASPVTAQ